MNYSDYLRSDKWQLIRRNALERTAGGCQLCGSRQNVQLHHRTYINIANEHETDLTVLCDRCHTELHKSGIAVTRTQAEYAVAVQRAVDKLLQNASNEVRIRDMGESK